MQKKTKKALAVVLSMALCASSLVAPSKAEAAKVKKIKLNKKKVTLYLGGKKADKKVKLKVTIKPKKAKKVKLKWTSSKKKVATVNKKGVVTAKKAGKTVITVKAGKKKAKCTIVVKKGAKPVKATTAPQTSVAPTTAPQTTVAPTVAPTTEPTVAPTEEPTEAPTEEPTEAPTTEPTVEPTEAPQFETEVEPTVDEDSTKYELDVEGEYKLTSSYGDGNNDIVLTNATALAFQKAMNSIVASFTEKSLEEGVETFKNATYDATYEAAKDVTVEVAKQAGSSVAYITVEGEGAPAKAQGTYSFEVFGGEDGNYSVSFAQNEDNCTVFIISQAEEGKYQISNVSVVKNGQYIRTEQLADRVFDMAVATTDATTTVSVESNGFTSAMTYNEETGASTLTMTTAQGNTTYVAYNGETVVLDIPNAYVEKYDIKLFQ